MITEKDINKYYILDNKDDNIVQLVLVAANGWCNVKQKNGTFIAVPQNRLKEYTGKQLETKLERVEDSKPDVVEKVQITIRRGDGGKAVKTLTGEGAEQWAKWVNAVCALAYTHDANPDWDSLPWSITKKR